MPRVAVLKAVVKASKETHFLKIASLSGPLCSTPPLPLPSVADGARFLQKSEWLMWPMGATVSMYRRQMRSCRRKRGSEGRVGCSPRIAPIGVR